MGDRPSPGLPTPTGARTHGRYVLSLNEHPPGERPIRESDGTSFPPCELLTPWLAQNVLWLMWEHGQNLSRLLK